MMITEAPCKINVPQAKKTRVVKRIHSIDILRGAVMLVMALDHVREYFHIHAFDEDPTNLATTTPALFFTRWITHYCAPVFIFLSGISAFISGQKKTKKELGFFLIKRGLWLVFAEVVIITFGLSFNPHYDMFFLQVIWAIGWSMVVLGLLVRTSVACIVIISCLIFFGHNLLDYTKPGPQGIAGILLNLFFSASFTSYHIGERTVVVLYAILPWTGIMLLGYAYGYFYQQKFTVMQRRKVLIATGLLLTTLFFVLRFINQYGDPVQWAQQRNTLYTLLSFLNVTKYPVSLAYCCITLGPAFIILALTEEIQNRFTHILMTYGKVPFFYYVLHFYLIHLLCAVFFFGSGHTWNEIADASAPFIMLFRPMHYGFNLWVVYAVWLLVIGILYRLCKWFVQYKSTHRQWWLNYF